MRFLRILGILTLLGIYPPDLFAGELVGQVLKGNGRPASNVTLRLAGPEMSDGREKSTNKNGFYKFSNLKAGRYTVTVMGRTTEVHVFGRKTRRDLRVP